MKALFFGLPLHGHTNPTLPLVRELARRGDEIVYYSTERFASSIASTGAVYRPYRNAFLPELGSIARRLEELAWLLMRTTAELLETELDAYRAEAPDYVVTDSVAPWGQWIGALLDVPIVTSVTTFAFNRHVMRYGASRGVRPRNIRTFVSKLRHIGRALGLRRELRRRYRVRGPSLLGTISGESDLVLVYTSRVFQPCADTFDGRYQFVGPLLAPREDGAMFPWDWLDERNLVYVSLGTLFNANPSFYRTCFDAFGGTGLQVVLSVGPAVAPESLGPPPPNVLVRTAVPQLELLERTSVFVSHGGMNSVSESLFHGVPVVVVPQTGEQEIVGKRTEELGAGVCLAQPDITAEHLRASVMRLSRDECFRHHAGTVGSSLRSAGGAARAAGHVVDFTRARARWEGPHPPAR